MELAGLEPATSWVRFAANHARGDPVPVPTWAPQGTERLQRFLVFAGRTCENRVCRPAILLA
jgi:hypothetical protein